MLHTLIGFAFLTSVSIYGHSADHQDHEHRHGAKCGHHSIDHDGHEDFLHDGHLHHETNGRVEDHVIAIDARHPAAEKPVSEKDRGRILQMGENFREVWESEHCSAETKKKIIRTVVEEVLVDMNDSGDKLHFIIHWKGGCYTDFDMEKPRSGVGKKTSLDDFQILQ